MCGIGKENKKINNISLIKKFYPDFGIKSKMSRELGSG